MKSLCLRIDLAPAAGESTEPAKFSENAHTIGTNQSDRRRAVGHLKLQANTAIIRKSGRLLSTSALIDS